MPIKQCIDRKNGINISIQKNFIESPQFALNEFNNDSLVVRGISIFTLPLNYGDDDVFVSIYKYYDAKKYLSENNLVFKVFTMGTDTTVVSTQYSGRTNQYKVEYQTKFDPQFQHYVEKEHYIYNIIKNNDVYKIECDIPVRFYRLKNKVKYDVLWFGNARTLSLNIVNSIYFSCQ